MRFYVAVVLLIFLGTPVFGQSKVQYEQDGILADSLWVEENVAKADSLKKAGKIQEAIDLLAQTEKTAQKHGDSYLIQLVGLALADSYLANDQPGKAEKVLQELLDRFPESELKQKLLSMMGAALRYRGQYDKAMEFQKQAAAIVDSLENPKAFARIQLNMASLYDQTGDLAAALKYYQKGIAVLEQLPDRSMLATALNNLGVTYNNLSMHEDAGYHLQRSVQIAEEAGDRLTLLRAFNNLAIAEKGLGDVAQAIATYDKALELHREVRKDTPPFRILYNLGLAHRDLGNLDTAEGHFQESLRYCEQAGIMQGLIYNYGGLASIEELRNNLEKAHDYFVKALEIARDIGARRLQLDALESLHQVEKKRENYARSLAYFEDYAALSDSLNAEAQQQDLARLETELGLRQQREVNRLLQEKQQQQEKQLATQNWVIILSAVIIVVVLLSLVLLYRAYTEKKRINQALKVQGTSLEELIKVKDKMMAIIAHDLRSPIASMHGMLYLIRKDDLNKEEMQAMAAEIEISLDKNINMMDNLLVWAQQQMSGMDIDSRPHNVSEIVSNVLEDFALRASHKGVTLHQDVSKNILVEADLNLLKLILRNLVANSLKFSNQGDRISIEASKQGEEIIFQVADTGIGMSDEMQKAVFSATSKSRLGTLDEKGSGLGLQLCKEFIHKQQGAISLESKEGEGTKFTFSLPAA